MQGHELRDAYERLLRHDYHAPYEERLSELRRLIITSGIPENPWTVYNQQHQHEEQSKGGRKQQAAQVGGQSESSGQVLPPSGHARSRSSSPMLLHPGSSARAAGIIGSGTGGGHPGGHLAQSGGQQPPQATPAIHGQTTSAPTAPLKRSGSPGAEPTSTSTAATKPASSSSSLRGAVWKVLLGVTGIDAREYVSLLSRGPSRCAGRISTDLPRTLKGDPTVQALSDARTRLLNAFAHWAEDEAARLRQAHAATAAAPSSGDDPQQQRRQPAQPGHRPSLSSSAHAAPVHIPEVVTSGYQQGMGSLAAVLLFVLPEVDAFAAFRQLVTHGIPGLYESSLAGVREGCGLADDVLAVVDPDVRSHLIDVYGPASSHAELMFYSRIAALYANRPPLEHVVRIWDCCFAFGAHLVVLLCAAECVLRRRELLEAGRDAITRFQGIGDAKDSSPNAPGTAAGPRLLDADQLVVVALELVQHLPPDLYQRLTAFSMRMSAPGIALDEAYRHQQLSQHQLDVQNETISVSRPSVFTTRQGWGAAADPRDRDGHGRAIATAAASSSASHSTGITAASGSGETDFDVGAGSSMESTGRPEAVHDQCAGGRSMQAQSLLQRKRQHQESQGASGSGSGSVTLPPPPTHVRMGGSGSKLLPATLPRPGTAGAGSSTSSAGAGASVAPSVAYRQRAGTTAPAAGIRASAAGSSQSTTSTSTSAHGVGSYSGGMHAKSPLAQWANAPPIASPSAGGASSGVGAARRPSASAVITGSHARIASGNGSSANTVSPSPGGYQYSYSYGLGRRSPANAAASTPGAGVVGGSSSASSASSGKGAAVGPSSSFARRREYQKALDEARRSGQPLLLHATLWSPSQHASTPGPAGTSTGASGGLTHGRRSSHGSVGSVHAAAAPAAGHHGHGIAASGWIPPPQLPPLGPHASVSAGAALVEIMSSAGTRTTGPSTATTTAAPTMGAGTARLRAGTGGSPSPPSVAGSVGSASADAAAGTGSRAASRGPALEDDVARAPGYASEPADHGSAAASASAFASAPPLSPAGKTTSSSPPPSSLGIGIIPSASAAAHAHAHRRSSGSGSEATAAVPDARHQHRRSGGDSSSGDNKAGPAASGVARRGYSHGHDGGHLHGHPHHGHRSRGGGGSGSQVHDIGSGSTALAGGGGGTASLVGSLSQAMADAILAHEAFRGIPGKDMDEDTALRRLQERRKQAAGVPVQGAVAASEASSGTHTPDATVTATGALPADAMHSAPAAASTTSWCWDPDTSDGLHPTDRSDTSSSLSSAAPGAVLTPPLAHLQHRILAGMGIGKPDAHGQQLHMLPDRLLATGCIGSRVGDGDAHITGQHAAATPSASSVVEHPDAETGHTSPCTAPAPPASASSSSQLAPSASPPPQPAQSSASHDMLTSPVYQGVSMVPQDEKNEYDSAASRSAGGGESTPSAASGKGSSAASATGTGTPAAAGGGHQRVGSGGSSASSRRSRRNVSGASSTSSHGRNLSAIADEVLGLLEAEGEAAAGTSGPQLVDVDTGRVSLPEQPPASSSSAAAAQLTAVANSQP